MRKVIVFQGDSITDAGRNYADDNYGCYGYATMVAAALGMDYPDKYKFYNRGVGGNRSVDLYARIKSDILHLKPDYLSILIGVNDVWFDLATDNGITVEKYEKIYTMLIEEILQALPKVKIMILEPFVLNGPSTQAFWPAFDSEVRKRAIIAKRIAQNFNLPFVALQERFDMVSNGDPTYWLIDGVHPSAMGHELIKREWIKAFVEII